MGHPEKIVDFSYRAVHEMTVKAKAVITAFYGRGPRLSYWNGCSTGGRQGLMEAQRYPEDFDGIVAGAPANFQTHLHAFDIVLQTAVRQPGAAVPPAKVAMLGKSVLDACDGADGVKDGFLNNPRKCNFDYGSLLCKGADTNDCLTAAQLDSVKRAHGPLMNAKGALVYPGYAKGSEGTWRVLSAANGPSPTALSLGTYREVLHQDPNWDWKTFDVNKDVPAVDEKYGYINAVNPDLSAVQGARRKAPHLPRLERYGDFTREQHQLSRERPRQDGRQAGQLVPAVHGARHGALPRRPWSQPVQFDGCDGAVAGIERRSGGDHGFARCQ